MAIVLRDSYRTPFASQKPCVPNIKAMIQNMSSTTVLCLQGFQENASVGILKSDKVLPHNCQSHGCK